ncbi:MAG: HlyD family efflux transporter periplasmic adaptor subunit [Planctomycetota bacterium]
MAVKLRKISETAYMEPPAGGIRRPFNYAKAFVLVGIAVVAGVVIVILLAGYMKGQVTTTNAWVEAREEVDYIAESDVVISELNFQTDDVITMEQVENKVVLYRIQAVKGTEAVGMVKEKEKALEMAEVRRRQAEDIKNDAKERLDRAEEYWKQRLITLDRYEDAQRKSNNAEADYEVAAKAVEEADARLEAERARLKVDMEYEATTPGYVWVGVKKGDRVSKDRPIMKIYNPDTFEIIAILDQNVARDVRVGQEVDIRVRTGAGEHKLKGKVSALVNPFFKKPPQERERIRTEIPYFDVTKQELRITVEKDEEFQNAKQYLRLGSHATVTIYTR